MRTRCVDFDRWNYARFVFIDNRDAFCTNTRRNTNTLTIELKSTPEVHGVCPVPSTRPK